MAKPVAEVLVDRLIDWGVNTIFGLPGDGWESIKTVMKNTIREVV